MTTSEAVVRRLPAAREHFLDERETLLRATWYPDEGFVNLSTWRGDRCVATFHLRAHDTARLAALLVDVLGGTIARRAAPAPARPVAPGLVGQVTTAITDVRRRLAAWIGPST